MNTAPESNFTGWTNVWAKDLQVGMQTTGGKITIVTVHADGSASVKTNRSPRVTELAANRFLSVRTGFKA